MAENAAASQANTYRFGGTFERTFQTSPEACAAQCMAQAACQAWSHVPAQGDTAAFCELKTALGHAETRAGFTSGVRSHAAPASAETAAAEEVGAAPKPTQIAGLRQRSSVFPEGYTPVSAGLDVSELLGAANAPARPVRAQPAARQPVQTYIPSPYAPKRVRQAAPQAGTWSAQSPSTTPSYDSSQYSQGQNYIPQSSATPVQARSTSEARSPDFYSDD
ncbi:MAG: PAN domain-containing protein [Pseudomonadota bacterium]